MTEGGRGRGVREFRARFPAEPASVPASRRFVADSLATLGRDSLAETATLCVSEMATNAVLHSGGHFMDVGLGSTEDAVRVFVEDDGIIPAAAITPRRGVVDEPASVLEEATTGRGLMIVSTVSRRWGVGQGRVGLRVWADIVGGGTQYPVRVPDRPDGEAETELPENWLRIFLLGCPAEGFLKCDQYLDDLAREIQLIAASQPDAAVEAVAARLAGVLRDHAMPRLMARTLAREAASAGEETSDFRAEVPRELALDIHRYYGAILEADEYCSSRRLLTSDVPPVVRQILAWLDETVYAQAAHGAVPVDFGEFTTHHGHSVDA